MNLLVIANTYPMFDRASGDLRFYQMLKILAIKHKVTFCAYSHEWQVQKFGKEECERYKHALAELGIAVALAGPRVELKQHRYDAVLFEFFFSALRFLKDVRVFQPEARAIVDSVDVHFHRLLSKARVTGSAEDERAARDMLRQETRIYRESDLVIAVSDADRAVLLEQAPDMYVEVIPNIHPMALLLPLRDSIPPTLVFVGGFRHEPNIDAARYFCAEVLPLVEARVPDVRLQIIGDSPPEEISRLANESVEVLGFVPDTHPYLENAGVSVAPLRYGAGIKGKVGEAMAVGLPVVTTSVGMEGFGLEPGKDVLVGDTPEAFAEAVVRVLADRELYDRLRRNGWQFIHERYSEEAVAERVQGIFDGIDQYPVRRIAPLQRVTARIANLFEDYVGWRLAKKQ